MLEPRALLLAISMLALPAFAAGDLATGIDEYHASHYDAAFRDLLPLAQAGNRQAQALVGEMYQQGNGVTANEVEAAAWLTKAADQGDVPSALALGQFWEQRSDYARALQWYEKAASADDENAAEHLAELYGGGRGVPRDAKKVMYWRLRSTEGQGAHDQFNAEALGDEYERGDNTPVDHAQAAVWWLKAAELGNADAAKKLADSYHAGRGVPQDYKNALYWYHKAGEADAWIAIGSMYRLGEGVPKDGSQALAWYQKADTVEARTLIGDMYLQGEGVTKDPAQAAVWFNKAAPVEGGDLARERLAALYEAGVGVPQDLRLAYAWDQILLDGTQALDPQKLFAMYAQLGTPVPADVQQQTMTAYKTRLSEYTQALQRVGVRLSQDDLSTAKSWAANWNAGDPLPPKPPKAELFNPANPSGEHTGYSTLTGKPTPHAVADGPAAKVSFYAPMAITIDSQDNLLIADSGNELIRRISPDGMVTTLAGRGGIWGNIDGPGQQATFSGSSALAVDAGGAIYVADTSNATVRRISATGVVSTLAGWAELTPEGWTAHKGRADGQGTAAHFISPRGIAVDAAGNVYVADISAIRRISASGMVSTLAGNEYDGSDTGIGNAARFNDPIALALDSAGNLYVAERGNEDIRKISPQGVVTLVAGLPGHRGDDNGPAAEARFDEPSGLAIDRQGNLFVTDEGNYKVKKISPDGQVSTVATIDHHTGWFRSGDDLPRLTGLAIDSKGKLFVLDSNAGTVLKITADGTVSVYAGLPQKHP